MSWLCPNCLNDQNDDSTIKCICGYDGTTPVIQNELLNLDINPQEQQNNGFSSITYFIEIVFGAVSATLLLPIVFFGNIVAIGGLFTREIEKDISAVLIFYLLNIGGLLGTIGLWWSLLSSPFREHSKKSKIIKMCYLLLGMAAALYLIIGSGGYMIIVLGGPCVVATRQLLKLTKEIST